MKHFTLAIIPLILIGCASGSSMFEKNIKTISYSEPDENGDQFIVAEEYNNQKGKTKDVVGVFKGKNRALHTMELVDNGTNRPEGGDYGGHATMGSEVQNELTEGLSDFTNALGAAVNEAIKTYLTGGLELPAGFELPEGFELPLAETAPVDE